MAQLSNTCAFRHGWTRFEASGDVRPLLSAILAFHGLPLVYRGVTRRSTEDLPATGGLSHGGICHRTVGDAGSIVAAGIGAEDGGQYQRSDGGAGDPT